MFDLLFDHLDQYADVAGFAVFMLAVLGWFWRYILRPRFQDVVEQVQNTLLLRAAESDTKLEERMDMTDALLDQAIKRVDGMEQKVEQKFDEVGHRLDSHEVQLATIAGFQRGFEAAGKTQQTPP